MSDYDNTNRGVLFHQEEKKSDNSPDLKGSINVGGTDYEIAAWDKVSKNGKPYLSLSIQEPWNKGNKQSDESSQEQPTTEVPY